MNILIITYSYTPDLTPRAFRWAAVAAQLRSVGHQVDVLCAADVGSAPPAPSDGVIVHRVRDWLINASTRVAPNGKPPVNVAQLTLHTKVKRALRKAVRFVWRSTHWPDYACGWILPAAKRARVLCTQNNYDWIVSVSHPFSGHIVGWLATRHAPGAKWLVDIGDPFCLMDEPSPNNRRVYSRLNRMMESHVLRLADAVSVTTEPTRHLYESYFTVSHGKLNLVPPLLSLPSVAVTTEPRQRPVVRLVFVGTLYRQLRSPNFILACFFALIDQIPGRSIELHFFGATNDCSNDLAAYSDLIGSSLFIHGMVSRLEAHNAMLDADILVNIGNHSASQLASKVIEYMAVGRPILNIVSLKDDASLTALRGHPGTLTLVRKERPSSEDLECLRSFIQAPPCVDESFVERVREKYSAAKIAERYLSIFSQ